MDQARDRGLTSPRPGTVCALDFTGNGKTDLLGTAFTDDQVAWYENPNDPVNEPWTKHIIDTQPQPIHGHPTDMDGDGGVDVVMALGMRLVEDRGPVNHQIVWYEHDGNPKGTWTKHVVWEDFPYAFEAVAADIDNDGQVEIIASAWGRRWAGCRVQARWAIPGVIGRCRC